MPTLLSRYRISFPSLTTGAALALLFVGSVADSARAQRPKPRKQPPGPPPVAAPTPAAAPAAAPIAAPADTDVTPPPIMREFRGVWVVTVGNGDWPSQPGLSTAQQKAEMLAILDTAAALHLNAIILQVRPGADALYASKIEPWSHVLTGTQGKAPEPFYDPLAFTIEEAHERGIEVHAWFNPFRVSVPDRNPSEASKKLVLRTHPNWVKKYGPYWWMDPSRPEVRARAIAVITDVVRRYDVDGVHIDDYFYPYREPGPNGRDLDFPDAAEYKRYRRHGGKLDRDDWRRRNVNLFVQEFYERVKATKKRVKVGISPFGIWRPGNPPSVYGLDAYQEIYADARLWLNRGWLDYLAPQLYWKADAPKQPYTDLLAWWVGENTHDRHIWPGLYTGHVAMNNSAHWEPFEITREIELTRQQPGASGEVHFSMDELMKNASDINDALRLSYAEPALVPASPWLDRTPPERPVITMKPEGQGAVIRLGVKKGAERPWLWTVRTKVGSTWQVEILPGDTREHHVIDPATELVYVTAVDRSGNESAGAAVALPGAKVPVRKEDAPR